MASIRLRRDRDKNIIGYQAIIRRTGYPQQIKTFRSKRDAEIWANAAESEMERGVFVDRSEASRTTLREVLERYKSEISTAKRGAGPEISRITAMMDLPLAARTMAAITSSDIAKWRNERLQDVSASTTKREMTILSHVFSIAIEEWGINLEKNPLSNVSRPKVNDQRDRRFQPEEEAALIEAATQYEQRQDAMPIVFMIRFLVETSMRRAELVNMQWQHVNLTRRTLRIPVSKTDTEREKGRTIPLSSKAVAVLIELGPHEAGPVWGNIKPDSVTRAFSRICARAGLKNLRLHDLRHEAISRIYEQTDLDALEVSRVSGHKSISMLSRYTHLRPDDLADRLDGKRRGGG